MMQLFALISTVRDPKRTLRKLPPAGPVAGAFAVLAAFALFFVGEKRSRRAGDGGDSSDGGFFDISGGDGGGDDGSD